MAITLAKEKETGTANNLTVPYMAQDLAVTLTRTAAVNAVLAQALLDQGTAAQDYQYKQLGKHLARVVVQYRPLQSSPLTPPAQNSVQTGFSFSMAPIELLYSLGRTKYPSSAPDFGGLINVPSGGETYDARGVKLAPPPEKFWKRWYAPTATVSSNYVNVVAGLVGTVNNGSYLGYAAGELCLVRATGAPRDDDSWALYFGWGYNPNVTGKTIGAHSVDIDGFQYYWPYHTRKIFTEGGKDLMALDPTYVYVDDVLPGGNHSLLTIP